MFASHIGDFSGIIFSDSSFSVLFYHFGDMYIRLVVIVLHHLHILYTSLFFSLSNPVQEIFIDNLLSDSLFSFSESIDDPNRDNLMFCDFYLGYFHPLSLLYM